LHQTLVKQHLSKPATEESVHNTMTEMEEYYREQIAAESNKDLFVLVEKGTKDAMNKSLDILKYEQILPNWKVFYMKVRNNETIRDIY